MQQNYHKSRKNASKMLISRSEMLRFAENVVYLQTEMLIGADN